MELVISLIATTISVVSLGWSVRTSLRQREGSAIAANLISLSQVEASIAEVPSALRFHGIELTDLEEGGITPEEFAYLLSNFTLGGVYYRSSPKAKHMIEPGTYRYEMCQAEATRKIWPVLRRMISPSPYRDALDQVFLELDKSQPLSQEEI